MCARFTYQLESELIVFVYFRRQEVNVDDVPAAENAVAVAVQHVSPNTDYMHSYRFSSGRCIRAGTSFGLMPLRNLNSSLSVDSTSVVFSAMIAL